MGTGAAEQILPVCSRCNCSRLCKTTKRPYSHVRHMERNSFHGSAASGAGRMYRRHWEKERLEAVPRKSLTQDETNDDHFVFGIIHRARSCKISGRWPASRGLFSLHTPLDLRLGLITTFSQPSADHTSYFLLSWVLTSGDSFQGITYQHQSHTISFLNRHLSASTHL